jgi:sugar lactone lactonase YvrE
MISKEKVLTVLETDILAEGLSFPESPRWHDQRIWISDMHTGWVMTLDLDGNLEKIVQVPESPSGLGWLPDGRLLVVSMIDRRLLRLDPEGLAEVADLRRLASFHCNDMVVDDQGRAYIGNFGFDFTANASKKPAELVLVTPDGQARRVAGDLFFPNGTVITPDGQTLIVAETFGHRLTAFDIRGDGTLGHSRLWADLKGLYPDGICLDAEGAVWVAAPHPGVVFRVRQGGRVTHRVKVSTKPYACMLGGPERRTLIICTAGSSIASGRIEIVEVAVPGAGWP